MRVYHLATDVGPWACARLARLDAALADAGSAAVHLPWNDFELRRDGTHFSRRGRRAFAEALARTAPATQHRTLLVISDSTVESARAARELCTALRARGGCRATIDWAGGTGFVNGSFPNNRHFRARARRRDATHEAVLFAGGWNDVGWDGDALCDAGRGAVASAASPTVTRRTSRRAATTR